MYHEDYQRVSADESEQGIPVCSETFSCNQIIGIDNTCRSQYPDEGWGKQYRPLLQNQVVGSKAEGAK